MNCIKTILVAALGILFFSCGKKGETVSPELKNITESVYASGIIKSKNQYEVYPKVSGIVNKIAVKEGDRVQAGQLLFTIEDPNAKLQVDNSKILAEINDYRANTEKLKDLSNSIELARKNLQSDSLLFARQQSLWDKNIGTKVELEQKELNFERSKVQLYQLEVSYNDLKRQLELNSRQSKNSLQISENAEKDLEIRSKVDGVVYKINIEEGELAAGNSTLAVIGEEDFIIELNVDELDIVKIRKGQKAFIRMDSYRSRVFEAEITYLYPMMNERTRSFEVEATFTQKPETLFPNLTLEANVVISEKQDVLSIPTRFLQSDSTVTLEDGTVKKVEVGLSDYNLTEIISGLDSNSKIILPKK
jgi:HlyD family secretion protein